MSNASTTTPATAGLWWRNWRHASEANERGARGATTAGARASVVSDTRVEDAIGNIREQVESHNEHRERKGDAHHNRRIAGGDCVDEQIADARDAEDLFRNHGARKDGWRSE